MRRYLTIVLIIYGKIRFYLGHIIIRIPGAVPFVKFLFRSALFFLPKVIVVNGSKMKNDPNEDYSILKHH